MLKLAPTLLLGLTISATAQADPCGMVPPVYTGNAIPITRVGEQQTYVFFKNGVETFVIRPGFSGKVDEFGMLIPFPTPPEIRKVPDHIFPHVAAAIDPPEVVIDRRLNMWSSFSRRRPGASRGLQFREKKSKDSVRVLKREAVGMYEVAVLEAGSAKALSRWMKEHGYKYPKGMDKACEDYVEEGWCFVAVKSKVGQKGGVNPKPGQRQVTSKLPSGSSFDGHVQGMGFRFRTKELVVPMRLSTFNKGELRNIVYLLTDNPSKIRSIPEEFVVRQISGKQLHHNLTELLPLRFIGFQGKITQQMADAYKAQRNPVPKNGAAADLFAADLHAVATGKLSLPHEQQEKDLLVIGERLGLRGGNIDKLHLSSLQKERKETLTKVARELETMTLTVIDGDFPREVLAQQNLTFAEYRMPSRRNSREAYDAGKLGPGGKQEGKLLLGANVDTPTNQMGRIWLGLSVLTSTLIGLMFFRHWRFFVK